MFERRLKIFLSILFVFTIALALRAVQVQVIDHGYWDGQAAETMKRSQLTETTRGSILDFRGRPVAVDLACIDAGVDYRAVLEVPDEAWVKSRALDRLIHRLGDGYRRAESGAKKQMLANEIKSVKADIQIMWLTLAKVSGKSIEEIDNIRREIVQKVEMRRRYIWYRKYQLARSEHTNRPPSPQWYGWLIDDAQPPPQIDSFIDDVAEQTQAHVILRAIDTNTNNFLGKNIEKYPGLVLRASKHRVYPYNDAACHVLGHLSRVNREDLRADPNVGGDELRKYYPNDLIGRTGIEALGEPMLRGSRGSDEQIIGEEKIINTLAAVPGRDVRMTIDIELQAQIQMSFERARTTNPDGTVDIHPMHGAAVVIDIPTGQVRALVSYPTFDPNQFEEKYAELSKDEINRPLMNRATQAQLEPGSTVKPVVGLCAITQGLFGANDKIECTGYLILNGKKLHDTGRCWVASKFEQQLGGRVAHHPIPWDAPHPDGFLTFADALERSCNVYFETLADRMKIKGLAEGFSKFGLGRPTGIGIAEASGRLPILDAGPIWRRSSAAWMAGIGQGQILATPIQMGNVAATIARNGVWMRPQLMEAGIGGEETRINGGARGSAGGAPGSENSGNLTFNSQLQTPDRVDLHLSPPALAAAREGMIRVVNNRAGTAWSANLRRKDVLIAGKTGTAQAAKFTVPLRDENNRHVRDEKGRLQYRVLQPGTKEHPNPQAPWYRGTGAKEEKLDHAWFIGFAPAENPRIAFAVMVEYGGSGGNVGASITHDVIEACVEHGYLSLNRNGDSLQAAAGDGR